MKRCEKCNCEFFQAVVMLNCHVMDSYSGEPVRVPKDEAVAWDSMEITGDLQCMECGHSYDKWEDIPDRPE